MSSHHHLGAGIREGKSRSHFSGAQKQWGRPPPNHACLEDMPESLGRPLPAPGPELPKAGPERVRVARVTQKPAEWIQHPRGGGLYLPR